MMNKWLSEQSPKDKMILCGEKLAWWYVLFMSRAKVTQNTNIHFVIWYIFLFPVQGVVGKKRKLDAIQNSKSPKGWWKYTFNEITRSPSKLFMSPLYPSQSPFWRFCFQWQLCECLLKKWEGDCDRSPMFLFLFLSTYTKSIKIQSFFRSLWRDNNFCIMTFH